MKLVWLFKSESSSQSYEQILSDNDFSAEAIPTLEFEYTNKEILKDALLNPDHYSGIIFTSVRGVQSVGDVFNDIAHSVRDKWANKSLFVVGKATGKATKESLNLDSIGSETGNAKQLGDLIINHSSFSEKPLLYICGNLKRDELPDILKENNINFKLIICYKTIVHHTLENRIMHLFSSQKPDFIVFFSPSGIEFSLPIFKKAELNITDNNFIALGPTTNACLIENNMNVIGVCSEPSPTGLLDVLKAV